QPGLPRLPEVNMTVHTAVLVLATSILTGLAFGLLPALALFRRGTSDFLGNGMHIPAGRDAEQTRSVLIVAQFAIAFTLLIWFGLITKSFVLLATRQLNFVPQGLLSLDLRIPQQTFMRDISNSDRRLFSIDADPSIRLQRVYERLQQLPG